MTSQPIEVRVETRIQATPAQIWDVISDHERMIYWTNLRKVVRRRPGFDEPNGVGAIRTLHDGMRVMEERITAFVPNERLEYQVTMGAPGRDTHGIITLEGHVGETVVRWTVRTVPYLAATGWLIRLVLTRLLTGDLGRIKDRLTPERVR